MSATSFHLSSRRERASMCTICLLPFAYCLVRSMNHELLKTCEELRRIGADGAVLGSIENVTYVTNVEQPVPVGRVGGDHGGALAGGDFRERRARDRGRARGGGRGAAGERAGVRGDRVSDVRQLRGDRSAGALCRGVDPGVGRARARLRARRPWRSNRKRFRCWPVR